MKLVKHGNIFKAIKKGAEFFAFDIGRIIKNLTIGGFPPITFENSIGEPLVNYKIEGNSKKQTILPDEYQQVEYIEATGTQYFEIDYIANEKTNSRGTFQITNTAKANFLFGSRVNVNSLPWISASACPNATCKAEYSLLRVTVPVLLSEELLIAMISADSSVSRRLILTSFAVQMFLSTPSLSQ